MTPDLSILSGFARGLLLSLHVRDTCLHSGWWLLSGLLLATKPAGPVHVVRPQILPCRHGQRRSPCLPAPRASQNSHELKESLAAEGYLSVLGQGREKMDFMRGRAQIHMRPGSFPQHMDGLLKAFRDPQTPKTHREHRGV